MYIYVRKYVYIYKYICIYTCIYRDMSTYIELVLIANFMSCCYMGARPKDYLKYSTTQRLPSTHEYLLYTYIYFLYVSYQWLFFQNVFHAHGSKTPERDSSTW